jgi:hypothetical protein
MGKMPHMDRFNQAMLSLEKKYHFKCYDYSTSIKDKTFYEDLDHLNHDGTLYFMKNYLRPILLNTAAQPVMK